MDRLPSGRCCRRRCVWTNSAILGPPRAHPGAARPPAKPAPSLPALPLKILDGRSVRRQRQAARAVEFPKMNVPIQEGGEELLPYFLAGGIEVPPPGTVPGPVVVTTATTIAASPTGAHPGSTSGASNGTVRPVSGCRNRIKIKILLNPPSTDCPAVTMLHLVSYQLQANTTNCHRCGRANHWCDQNPSSSLCSPPVLPRTSTSAKSHSHPSNNGVPGRGAGRARLDLLVGLTSWVRPPVPPTIRTIVIPCTRGEGVFSRLEHSP